MASYGSDDVVIEFDVTDGGSLTDISQYIQSINGIDVESIMEMSHTFGDAWEEHLPVGVKKMGEITLEGLYDDGANVSGAFFTSAHTQTRTFKITYGSTKTTSVETWITKRSRKPQRNALTRFSVTLQPTGTVTEA